MKQCSASCAVSGDTWQGYEQPGAKPCLRRLTRHWLTQHQQVLGYCDAPSKDGGSGAALVLLKISL